MAIPLSACGEAWEAKLTDKIFPYGNKRTAGSGVVYVLAKMMPKKELKLAPISMEHYKETQSHVKSVIDVDGLHRNALSK